MVESEEKLRESILSILEGSSSSTKGGDDDDNDGLIKVKKLRKLVLLSLQLDESDKDSKKQFKKIVQSLEKDNIIKLDADGKIQIIQKKRKRKDESKKSKKDKKKKKKKKKDDKDDDEDENDTANNNNDEEEVNDTKGGAEQSSLKNKKSNKNISCKNNPQGITRLFVGNLPFAVDETSLGTFIPGITHIKWITDQETGKFYGSAFIEMDNSTSAANAVTTISGSQLMGRPIKINYAPARPGDKWPPEKKVITGGGTNSSNTTGAQASSNGIKTMSTKPPDCKKLFIGNLSYDIDDDTITKFFATVDAEIKAIRWLHHKDTGDFKGVGFVEFWNTEACEKAATLNGKNLLGRPIRIDWTD